MIPINYSGFRLRDLVSRALPGYILGFYSVYVALPHSDLYAFFSNTGVLVLVTVIAYPLGLTTEQIALTLRQAIFGKTNFLSDDKLIKRHLDTDRAGFWLKYIRVLSESDPNVSTMIEQYNLTRFFFLNMAFLALSISVSEVLVKRSFCNPLTYLALLLSIVSFLYHVQFNRGFYIIVGFAHQVLHSKSPKSK